MGIGNVQTDQNETIILQSYLEYLFIHTYMDRFKDTK
jgi:hypothetical protein